MKRNLFIKEEIVLCTYIARFGKQEFNEDDVSKLKTRSVSSIKMKVQNIAAMLDEEGYKTSDNIAKLTGKTTGEKGRRTNWDVVSTLVFKTRPDLLSLCEKIINPETF